MACIALSTGRSLGCTTNVGGLKNVYFAEFGTLGETVVGGEITTLGTPDLYRFEIKSASSLDTAITHSRENGSTFYTQTLALVLPILDLATQEEIKKLAVSRPHVIVEDYNGKAYVVGLLNGAEMVSGNITTGAAMGDLSGFSVTFEAQEVDPPAFINMGVVTPLISAIEIDPNA